MKLRTKFWISLASLIGLSVIIVLSLNVLFVVWRPQFNANISQLPLTGEEAVFQAASYRSGTMTAALIASNGHVLQAETGLESQVLPVAKNLYFVQVPFPPVRLSPSAMSSGPNGSGPKPKGENYFYTSPLIPPLGVRGQYFTRPTNAPSFSSSFLNILNYFYWV